MKNQPAPLPNQYSTDKHKQKAVNENPRFFSNYNRRNVRIQKNYSLKESAGKKPDSNQAGATTARISSQIEWVCKLAKQLFLCCLEPLKILRTRIRLFQEISPAYRWVPPNPNKPIESHSRILLFFCELIKQ